MYVLLFLRNTDYIWKYLISKENVNDFRGGACNSKSKRDIKFMSSLGAKLG